MCSTQVEPYPINIKINPKEKCRPEHTDLKKQFFLCC